MKEGRAYALLRKGVPGLILLALGALSACAQDLTISASVDKNVVTLDDQVMLTVTVTGSAASLPDPQLPSLPNFTVYSSGRSQNISFINGQVSSAISYQYVLSPRFAGKSVIGPISLTAQGRTVQTAPIEITCVRPSGGAGQAPGAAPQAPPPAAARASPGAGHPAGPDVFVTASLDKRRAHVNEQVTLTVRFYSAVSLLGNAQYFPPTAQGFLSEDLPPERHGQAAVRGRLYHYSEIKTALFPVQPGRLAIAPALVRCQVQTDADVDPFSSDFFQRFFSQGMAAGRARDLRTEPLELEVAPLPQSGRPASFAGAVGRFKAASSVDKRSAKVGEAVTLTFLVEGAGNLKALESPKLPELPAFRTYDTISSLNMRKDKDVVQGSKAFRTVLVPRASGRMVIPSIPFSWFDPSADRYVQAATAPIELDVAAAAPGSPAVGYASPNRTSPDLTALGEDIRYIKESLPSAPVSSALRAAARGRWIHLLPLIAFLCAGAAKLYRDRLNLDPAGRRFRSALAAARRRIDEAGVRHAANSPQQAAELLEEALARFLADKLDRSASGLTLREATDLLRGKFPGVKEETLQDIKGLWEDLEAVRFAGDGSATSEAIAALLKRAGGVLRKLDQEIRR